MRSVVADSYGFPFEIGEQVLVEVTSRLARTAMLVAFGVPTVLALFVLFPMNAWCGEMVACVATLAMIGLYYAILYMFRARLDRKVVFVLHRKNN